MRNISKIVFIFTAIILTLLLSSCSKDNPAAVESGLVVAVQGSLYNSNLELTILKGELLFDGSSIGSLSYPQPQANIFLIGNLPSVKKGTHTVAFKIVSQASSTNTYEVLGTVVADGKTYNLDTNKIGKSLNTGESISFTVDIQ